jgi:hypothetical protein
MLRRLRQGLEQLDPGSAVADSFKMGRALAGVLTRSLPVGNGLLGEACLGIVKFIPIKLSVTRV